MGCSPGFDTGAGTTGDGVDGYMVGQEVVFCQREETELDGGCKASGIGNMTDAADGWLAVELGKTVNKVVRTIVKTIVGSKVDDEQYGRDFWVGIGFLL